MKVAIVHDDFMQWGGAERVVLALSEIWPDAPIYTIAYNEHVLPEGFPVHRLRTSFLQRSLFKKLLYPKCFFLDPLLFEQFNFNDYDVVVSSSSRFAKSVITQPQTVHIAYINTPPRFLWPVSLNFSPQLYIANFLHKLPFGTRTLSKLLLKPILTLLRMHDFAAAQRIDYLIGNSKNVAWRIQKVYNREADYIHPFVELERFGKSVAQESQSDYFLIVSRLTEHKRIDLAVEAFNELGLPLKIIGTGPARASLEKSARSNVEFLGYVSDAEVVEYLYNCRAFVYPQEEDFGITALEAQAAGKPVIAFGAGGALETVVEGETGLFFYPQTKDALVDVLRKFDAMTFDREKIVRHVQHFSRDRFKQEMEDYVTTHIITA